MAKRKAKTAAVKAPSAETLPPTVDENGVILDEHGVPAFGPLRARALEAMAAAGKTTTSALNEDAGSSAVVTDSTAPVDDTNSTPPVGDTSGENLGSQDNG